MSKRRYGEWQLLLAIHLVPVTLHIWFVLSTPSVPKLLSYFPYLFVPKWLSGLYVRLEFEAQSQIFLHQTFYIKLSFDDSHFRGRFRVVLVFYFKSHIYNYLVNGQPALVLPKLETQTIILKRRESWARQIELVTLNTKVNVVTYINPFKCKPNFILLWKLFKWQFLGMISNGGITPCRNVQKLPQELTWGWLVLQYEWGFRLSTIRATSNTRLRARDQYTSSTLIGGKGGAGPSSLHTTLEGPTEYVNTRWMYSLHGFLNGIKWIMFHGFLDYFQKPPLGGRSNTKPEAHGTPNVHDCWFILFCHVWGPAWIEIHWNIIWLRARSHMTSHYTWGPLPQYMILEECWDGLWTFSFGLSQFHGHGSCVKWA